MNYDCIGCLSSPLGINKIIDCCRWLIRSFDEVASSSIRSTLKIIRSFLRNYRFTGNGSVQSLSIWVETDLEFKRDKYKVQKTPQVA